MESQTFQNENFLVEATDEGHCRLGIKVTLSPQATQKAYLKAVKTVNKQISVPGFRKGHAPNQTVISRYSSYVEQEWKDLLVNEAYRAALDLTNIYPLNKESVSKPKIEKSSQEEGSIVSLSYEHYPKVPQVEFAKLSLPTIEREPIPPARIDEIIEEVRRTHADWEEIADRPVKEGDFVDISIDSLEEETPRPIVTDRRFEVADQRLAPWLKQALLERRIAESVETTTEVDPLAEERIKKSFKPTRVRITLHAIKKILLPEMSDALAQKAGASSLEELHQKIQSNLEKEAEEEHLTKRIKALENLLLQTYHFDLPASILESERRERTALRLQSLKEEGLSDDDIKAQQHEIERVVSLEIDHALRLYFLNKQIVKQGAIALTNQELNAEIVRYLTQNPHLYQEERNESDTRNLVSRMAAALLERKAKEYALAQIAI